jgi:hypothetical protein
VDIESARFAPNDQSPWPRHERLPSTIISLVDLGKGSHEMRAFAIILAAAVTAACSPSLAQAQTDLDDLAGKRVAPEIGTTGYSIATEERRHAAYPRQRGHCRSRQYVSLSRCP